MKAECQKKHKVTLSQLIAEEEATQRNGEVRLRCQVTFKSGAPRGDIGKHLVNTVEAIKNNQFKSHTQKARWASLKPVVWVRVAVGERAGQSQKLEEVWKEIGPLSLKTWAKSQTRQKAVRGQRVEIKVGLVV